MGIGQGDFWGNGIGGYWWERCGATGSMTWNVGECRRRSWDGNF